MEEENLLEMDEISDLPDDILVHILSYLTMKEAGMTSVLSKRWIHVWAYLPILNFDSHNLLEKIDLGKTTRQIEVPKYMHWVDKVVSTLKAHSIDELNIHFDLQEENNNGQIIDNWFIFAMEKLVKRLHMNFSGNNLGRYKSLYPFPSSFFCSSLISLELTEVNITGEALEVFFRNCRNLENLSVTGSELLVGLRVVGASLHLKHVTLMNCLKLKHLEICAPNLVYCNYDGNRISIPFRSTPKLSELSIGFRYGIDVTNNFMEHSRYLSQLDALTLDLPTTMKRIMRSVQFPKFTKLKKLDVTVSPWSSEDLFPLSPLIMACPLLHKFVLKMTLHGDEERIFLPREMEINPHYHLKIVEIIGFEGKVIDTEYAIHLMDVAVALQKIIIDHRYPLLLGSPWEFGRMFDRKFCSVRKKAKHLRAHLKPGIDLVIV